VRTRRDGSEASARKEDDVGTTERRRGQADGVGVFRQGRGGSFYRAGEGHRGAEGG
jgi:hypothetical protein